MGMKWEPGLGYQGGASDEFDVGPTGKHVPFMVANHKGEMVHNRNYHRDMQHRPASGAARQYHAVPFAKKDEAKREGMQFDGQKKKWFHTDSSKSAKSPFKRLNEANESFEDFLDGDKYQTL